MWLDPTGQWFGYIAYVSSDRLVLRRFCDFEQIGMTPGPGFAISPSGREFLGRGEIYLDPQVPNKAIQLPTDWLILPDTSAFSPDGKKAAWGTEQGLVLLVDIEAVRQRLAGLRN